MCLIYFLAHSIHRIYLFIIVITIILDIDGYIYIMVILTQARMVQRAEGRPKTLEIIEDSLGN